MLDHPIFSAQCLKAYVAALVSGLSSLMATAAQVDFNTLTNNQIRDMVVAFFSAGVAAFAATYLVPNNTPPTTNTPNTPTTNTPNTPTTNTPTRMDPSRGA